MKRIILSVLALFVGVSMSFAEGDHAYVGVKKCSMCHKGEKKGKIFETWQESKHAHAFAALGEPAALEVYKKLGKEGSPQNDPACLKCHVTGYGVDSVLTEKIIPENGVTCESCHGAGGDYWKIPIMKNREKAVASGLVDKPKEGCIKCHNEESPQYKEFKFEEFFEKIKHQRPKA